jgi:hypothetical protein
MCPACACAPPPLPGPNAACRGPAAAPVGSPTRDCARNTSSKASSVPAAGCLPRARLPGGSAAVAPAAPPWHVSQCCLFFSNPLCARVFCAQSATLCFALFFARLCSCALVVRTEFLIACGATRKETCSTGHHRESCTTVQRRFDMMLAWCWNSTGSRYISTVLKSSHHNILFFVLDFCSNLTVGGMTRPNMGSDQSTLTFQAGTQISGRATCWWRLVQYTCLISLPV